jgi:hypothetical protein
LRFVSIAALCRKPAEMATTSVGASSNTGESWFTLFPLPSWLLALYPHANVAPPTFTAREWFSPAAMSPTPDPRAATCTGVTALVVDPMPSWPKPFAPQAHAVPSGLIARVCDPPAAMATAVPSDATSVGFRRSVVVPSPSWPASFAPHARTLPFASSARLCRAPAAIATTFESPETWTGARRSAAVVPSPSCPSVLSPQDQTVPSTFSMSE